LKINFICFLHTCFVSKPLVLIRTINILAFEIFLVCHHHHLRLELHKLTLNKVDLLLVIAFGHMHHHKLDNLWLISHVLFINVDFRVLTLLSYALQYVQRLLRNFIEEYLHAALIPLDDIAEEFLCVRAGLSARPRRHILFYLLPVLAEHLQSLKEPYVFHQRPSAIFRTLILTCALARTGQSAVVCVSLSVSSLLTGWNDLL